MSFPQTFSGFSRSRLGIDRDALGLRCHLQGPTTTDERILVKEDARYLAPTTLHLQPTWIIRFA
jgi:hypothetical protein